MNEAYFVQILIAVLMGVGGAKGIEIGWRKLNGGPNSLSSSDKEMLTATIKIHSQDISKEICEAIRQSGDKLERAIREENSHTRKVIHQAWDDLKKAG